MSKGSINPINPKADSRPAFIRFRRGKNPKQIRISKHELAAKRHKKRSPAEPEPKERDLQVASPMGLPQRLREIQTRWAMEHGSDLKVALRWRERMLPRMHDSRLLHCKDTPLLRLSASSRPTQLSSILRSHLYVGGYGGLWVSALRTSALRISDFGIGPPPDVRCSGEIR
jgi:hypothetical protein